MTTICNAIKITDNYFVSQAQYHVVIDNSNFDCKVEGNYFTNVALVSVQTATRSSIKNNFGYVTENSGTATVLNTTTSIVVTHGLSYTPSLQHIMVLGAENPTTAVGTIWVTTITSTQFTINVENDPGASNFDMVWHVARTP